MIHLRSIVIALVAVLSSGCQDDAYISHAFFSRPGSKEPLPTDPQNGLERLIDGAQKELLFCMFRFNLEGIADALVRAHERGVAIRVFTDQDCKLAPPPSAYRRLAQVGISVTCDAAIFNSVMHHKFIVVDNSIVWTGDWNTHESDTFKAHHSAIQVHSPRLAAVFSKLFQYLTSGGYRDGLRGYPPPQDRSCVDPSGVAFTIHHAPEVSGSSVIAKALAEANSDIVIAHCYLGDRWVVKELLHAARRGVRVRGVYNSPSNGYERSLALQGIDIRKAAPTFVGSKYFIVDGQRLLTGSWNCSGTHPDHDNILEIDGDESLCQSFKANFEGLFATATPFFSEEQKSKITTRASGQSLPPGLAAEVLFQADNAAASVQRFRLDRKIVKAEQNHEVLLEIDTGNLDPASDWTVDLWVAPLYHKSGEYLERWNKPLAIQANKAADSGPLYGFTFAWPHKGRWRMFARIVRVSRTNGERRIVGLYSAPFVQTIR
ncbi:MAG: phosphatidylserine/phosphatidylglycerophosphate/cardiolipin synthase-like enzyme [Planctomycetota bacterium]